MFTTFMVDYCSSLFCLNWDLQDLLDAKDSELKNPFNLINPINPSSDKLLNRKQTVQVSDTTMLNRIIIADNKNKKLCLLFFR
jgi:hypothetical protein